MELCAGLCPPAGAKPLGRAVQLGLGAGSRGVGSIGVGPADWQWVHGVTCSPPASSCSIVLRPGAAVSPGGGQAAQERQCGDPRVCAGWPLQARAVPPLHWLLLVCARGHGPPHSRHIHQVRPYVPGEVWEKSSCRGRWAPPAVSVAEGFGGGKFPLCCQLQSTEAGREAAGAAHGSVPLAG